MPALRILVDGYDMSVSDRSELLGVINKVVVVERAEIAAQLETGDVDFVDALHRHGGRGSWE